MRVVFVLHSLVYMAGIERVMSDKMNYMAQQGHKVIFVTYEQGEHQLAYPLDPNVEHLDLDCRFFTLYKYKLFRRYLKMWQMKREFYHKLLKVVLDWSPDAVIVPTNVGEYMHEVMKLPNTRKIVEAHCALKPMLKANNIKEKIKNLLVFKDIKRCDLLIALTHNDSLCWRQYVKNVKTVPNHVAFYLDEIDYSKKDSGRILAIGRYHIQKRLDRLVEAFALIASKYPDWYIDIFGKGEYGEKEKLQVLIDKNKMNGRIILHDPTDNVLSEYQRSQFLAFSSDYEGFGLALIEAMACGTPVVSTDCPYGPSEIIEDGVTGLLSRMDVEDFSEKMEWMITHDAERNEMGIKAHHSVARYKPDVVMKEWEKAYLSVLKR